MDIPFATIERIANYLRCLRHLQDNGVKRVSSKELSVYTKTTPEQVRKDLSYFGRFGKTGAGYDVALLIKKLDKILKQKTIWNVCVIGIGSLGRALSNYKGFEEIGYNIVALFDNDPKKIGERIRGRPVYSIERFQEIVNEKEIEIAILAVPQSSLNEIETLISKSKIKGVLNFVPHTVNLKTRRRIAMLDIDLAQKMYILSYLIKNKREEV